MALYSKGKISIPSVTGNLVINITAVPNASPLVNLVPTSLADGGGSIYNDVGYKNGVRFNSSFGETAASGSAATGWFPFDKTKTLRVRGMNINDTTASYLLLADSVSASANKTWVSAKASAISSLDSNIRFKSTTTVRDTNGDIVIWDGNNENNGNCWLEVIGQSQSFFDSVAYARISTNNDGANLIITNNQAIPV